MTYPIWQGLLKHEHRIWNTLYNRNLWSNVSTMSDEFLSFLAPPPLSVLGDRREVTWDLGHMPGDSCWMQSWNCFSLRAFCLAMGCGRVYRWHRGVIETFGGRLSSGGRTVGPSGTLWRTAARRPLHCPPPWTSWKTADGCPYGGRSSQTSNCGTWSGLERKDGEDDEEGETLSLIIMSQV